MVKSYSRKSSRKNAVSKKSRRTSTKSRSPRASVMAKKNAKRARASLKPAVQPSVPPAERADEQLGLPESNMYPDVNEPERETARTEDRARKRIDIGDSTMEQGK